MRSRPQVLLVVAMAAAGLALPSVVLSQSAEPSAPTESLAPTPVDCGSEPTESPTESPTETAAAPTESAAAPSESGSPVESPAGPADVVTLVAGGGTNTGDGEPATKAKLERVVGLAVGPDGTIWLTEDAFRANVLRSITPDGRIHTNATAFDGPQGVGVAPSGQVFVADRGSSRVVAYSPGGKLTTVAGESGRTGSSGDGGPARRALLVAPYDVALDVGGNLYVADSAAQRVRGIDSTTGIIDPVAGNGQEGWSGDCGQATDAQLDGPEAIEIDPSGTMLYIADHGSSRVRLADLDSGIITTVAGNGASPGLYDPKATGLSTALSRLDTIALGTDGNLYLPVFYTDKGVLIMKLDPDGALTPVAGLGTSTVPGVPAADYRIPAAVNALTVDDVTGSLLVALDDGTVVSIPGIQAPQPPHPPLP